MSGEAPDTGLDVAPAVGGDGGADADGSAVLAQPPKIAAKTRGAATSHDWRVVVNAFISCTNGRRARVADVTRGECRDRSIARRGDEAESHGTTRRRSRRSGTVDAVDTPGPPELFADLTDATDALRTFLEETEHDQLDAQERRMLERLVETLQEAEQAVSRYVESIVKRSTGRPRR